MPGPLHTVAETPGFLDDCADAGVSDEERRVIVDAVAKAPHEGDLVQGTGGVFKRRFAGRGKGKSGGWRVMIAYVGAHAPAYLLALLSKGDRGNFSRAELSAMRDQVAELKRFWKRSTEP
jgi:hypothetical protein